MELMLTDVHWWWLSGLLILMAVPTVEFRSLDITGTEPGDRTTAGSVVSAATPLDFGTVNNTAAAADAGPKCLIFRCSNLQGNTTINNLRFWLSSNADFTGTDLYYTDITNTWTQNKTVGQVSGGTPGAMPDSVPAANVTKIGGGDITGIAHADTSQYLYIAVNVGVDEVIGVKGGAGGAFAYSLKFDYS